MIYPALLLLLVMALLTTYHRWSVHRRWPRSVRQHWPKSASRQATPLKLDRRSISATSSGTLGHARASGTLLTTTGIPAQCSSPPVLGPQRFVPPDYLTALIHTPPEQIQLGGLTTLRIPAAQQAGPSAGIEEAQDD